MFEEHGRIGSLRNIEIYQAVKQKEVTDRSVLKDLVNLGGNFISEL